jgi:hypothetical protein
MKQIILPLFMLLSFSASAADNTPWWNFWQESEQVIESGQVTESDQVTEIADQLFTQTEKNILQDYLGTHSSGEEDNNEDKKSHKKHKKDKKKKKLPKGLQKKLERGGQLPPGWQKKLARGEVLGADVYESSSRLPRDILDRLPSGPEGTSIRHIEDRVVRIFDGTREILDILIEK